ncbi:MAG: hypothetical protein R6V32_00935 [Bacteroidales bacterium]
MTEYTPEIREFIRENSDLFWYTPDDKKGEISEDLLVETILNYGDMNAVRKLLRIMGVERVAQIFQNLEGRQKLNYYPEIYNFFKLYFDRYA